MSLNDPEWGNRGSSGNDSGGRRPNQGPPDLDELWRDLNRRLSGVMGKKGGGGNRGGGQGPVEINSKLFGGGIGVLLVLILLAWLASGFYIVDASQRGVVLQFGRYHEVTEPGLRWRLPFPVQSHEIVNLSGVRTNEIGYRGQEKNKVLREALMLTDDENIINIQFAVQWYLKDPKDYVFNNRSPDDTVVQAAESAMREVVGKSPMNFALYEGREEIAARASGLVQEILDRYGTGIIVSKLTLQNAQPPEQVQAAFDDAVKAGQDRERQKNEGQAYANDIVPKAQGTASRLRQEAEGYKQRVIAAAEGDASRFKQVLTEYSRAPEVTRQRMYLETMQEVFTNTTKVMVDSRGQGNLLFLPLDKLIQATNNDSAADTLGSVLAGQASGLPTPPVPEPEALPARRALSRDRGGR